MSAQRKVMVGNRAPPDVPKSEQFSQPTNSQSTCPATQSALPKHVSQTIYHPKGASSHPQLQGNKSWPQRNPEAKWVSRQPCKSTWSLRSYQGSGNSPTIQLEFFSTTVPKQAVLFSDFLGDIPFYGYTHIWRPESQMETLKYLSLLVPSWRKGQPSFPRTFHGDSATDLKSSTMSRNTEKWRMNFFCYKNKFPLSLPLPLY